MATLSATSYRSAINLTRQLRYAQEALYTTEMMLQEKESGLEILYNTTKNDPNPIVMGTLRKSIVEVSNWQKKVIDAEANVKRIESMIRLLNSAA